MRDCARLFAVGRTIYFRRCRRKSASSPDERIRAHSGAARSCARLEECTTSLMVRDGALRLLTIRMPRAGQPRSA